MTRFDTSAEDLIVRTYLIDEENRDAIIWEQDGEVLMLTIPAELNNTDALPYCYVEKYVRNTSKQSFDVEEIKQ